MLIHEIAKIIQSHVESLYPEISIPSIELQYPSESKFGDFTSNIAMVLGKAINQNPRETAKSIVLSLEGDKEIQQKITKIEIAGPGFINLHINSETLWRESSKYFKNDKHQDIPQNGQRVMVEYSSPNIAKPFNVGHLRSTIIGDSLARMYGYLGADVIKDNHIGDWGTQYGKLAYAVEQWGDWSKIEQNPIPELFQLYVRFHEEEENNPDLTEMGREYFKRLEEKDPHLTSVWKKLVSLSLEDFAQLYQRLRVDFDLQLGESFYESMLSDVIEECKSTGIAKESEGALLIFFENDSELKNTPLMIQKSNGTSTYGTRDLAGVKYRFSEYDLDKLVIEIGNDQQHYFKQVIRASEMMGWVDPGQLIHVGHGIFSLPTGKMSTRKGRTIDIKELIAELEAKAREILSDREGMSEEEKLKTASEIAIGALKYNDLSQNRNSDIVFNREKALALEGNSAPYLQYIIARSNSILRTAEVNYQSYEQTSQLVQEALGRTEELAAQERELLSFALRFDSVVSDAATTSMPHIVANYLFQLSQKYNSFYHACPVLQSESKIRSSRLVVVSLTRLLLERGLNLLGISSPSKM